MDLDRSPVQLDAVLICERSSQGHREGQGHKSDTRALASRPSLPVHLMQENAQIFNLFRKYLLAHVNLFGNHLIVSNRRFLYTIVLILIELSCSSKQLLVQDFQDRGEFWAKSII